MKYSAEQYNKIFATLPPEIKDIVASQLTSEKLWAIGQNHKLHVDKISILHDMALDVMMGIIGTKNFAKEIMAEVESNPLEASAIARDVDDEIFKPIRTTMQKLYGEGNPNKPSSSLVEFHEKEDDLNEAHRDAILKEIEEPSPVSFKKILVETIASGNKKTDELEPKVKPKKHLEIEKYKEEIENPTKENAEEKIPAVANDIKTRILDNIATLSLSKSMVMPKAGESFPKPIIGAPVTTQKPSEPTKTTEKVSATETNPSSTRIDPYREPIH